jgi:hypothetical protein
VAEPFGNFSQKKNTCQTQPSVFDSVDEFTILQKIFPVTLTHQSQHLSFLRFLAILLFCFVFFNRRRRKMVLRKFRFAELGSASRLSRGNRFNENNLTCKNVVLLVKSYLFQLLTNPGLD